MPSNKSRGCRTRGQGQLERVWLPDDANHRGRDPAENRKSSLGFQDSSLGDDSEKSVGSSEMMLLMRQIRRCRESHHRKELGEKLCTKLPPRVPQEILRNGHETADRHFFQIRMKCISDDEQSRQLSALLDDSERIAAVQ